jgi:hypothetical protein
MVDEKTMVELLNEIPSAKVIRQQTEENEIYKKEITKYVGYVNDSIQRAKSNGMTYAHFACAGKYEYEVKKLFKEKGYWFKPTGIIGGVRQDTEDICW